MNNKFIFSVMLFTQYGIASEIERYPQYKQIMEINSDTVCPLPLILENKYYARLAIKANEDCAENSEIGVISAHNNNLHVEIVRTYSSELTGIYRGTFLFFESDQIISGEKATTSFLDRYKKLRKIADGKPICMELIERLDGAGNGQELNIMPEIRSFVINHEQVNGISDEMNRTKPKKTTNTRSFQIPGSGIPFFAKVCGFGLLGIVVVYYFRFLAK